MARTWADDTWPVTTMPPNSPCYRPTSSVPCSVTIPVSAIRTILASPRHVYRCIPKTEPPLLLVAVPPPASPTSGFVHRTLGLLLTTACVFVVVFLCFFWATHVNDGRFPFSRMSGIGRQHKADAFLRAFLLVLICIIPACVILALGAYYHAPMAVARAAQHVTLARLRPWL
jgi:hypothetical protein